MKSKNLHNLWEFARASRVLIAALIFSFTTLTAFVALTSQRPAQAARQEDCSTNSIIQCGVKDVADFVKKYKANATGDLDDIYQINSSQLAQLQKSAVHGTVYKDGRVVVNGKVVGTNAKSMGREYIKGSISWKAANGTTYYLRSTSISFEQNSLDALVVMDKNGKAVAALLTACGNPVIFTPKTPPKKTTPPPKTTPPTPTPPPATKTIVVTQPTVVKEKEVVKEVVKEQPKEELPQTGAENLAQALSVGSLAGAGYYWKSSRRNLLARLRRR